MAALSTAAPRRAIRASGVGAAAGAAPRADLTGYRASHAYILPARGAAPRTARAEAPRAAPRRSRPARGRGRPHGAWHRRCCYVIRADVRRRAAHDATSTRERRTWSPAVPAAEEAMRN